MRKHIMFCGGFLVVLIVMHSAHIADSQSSQSAQDSQGITITMPINKQKVKQFGETISFQTDVPVGEDETPVVFIKDPINQWWPWLQARPVSDEREEWELKKVQFGVEDDSRQNFQIQVLLFSNPDIEDGFQIEVRKKIVDIEIEAEVPIKNSIFKKLRERQQIRSDVITVIRK